MNSRKAFILMPFKEPYEAYYTEIFKPALKAAAYSVSRADDVFTPRPIMLDIQRSILGANLILCEMSERNPNVFYELGLAHAIGKPVILVSRKEEDIPFDLRHIRVIIYDCSRPGWDVKLKDSIIRSAESVKDSNEIWPPSLISDQTLPGDLHALGNEIAFNLAEIDKFIEIGYRIDRNGNIAANGKPANIRYMTCMVGQFESSHAQKQISRLDKAVRDDVFRVYQGFREINNFAEALKQVFRPWRATQYIQTFFVFQEEHRTSAEELVRKLCA